jgi:hypothetical protein
MNDEQSWWLRSTDYRDDGYPVDGMFVDKYGTKRWWLNGMQHREDGPACEYANGYKSWYLNDQLHREDGPAREWSDGEMEWYINNNTVYSKLENNLYLYNDLSEEFKISIIKYELTKT